MSRVKVSVYLEVRDHVVVRIEVVEEGSCGVRHLAWVVHAASTDDDSSATRIIHRSERLGHDQVVELHDAVAVELDWCGQLAEWGIGHYGVDADRRSERRSVLLRDVESLSLEHGGARRIQLVRSGQFWIRGDQESAIAGRRLIDCALPVDPGEAVCDERQRERS